MIVVGWTINIKNQQCNDKVLRSPRNPFTNNPFIHRTTETLNRLTSVQQLANRPSNERKAAILEKHIHQ